VKMGSEATEGIMSVKPSPAVERAGRLLKVLASEPATSFSLSELARRTGIQRASCHTVMLALASEGLVQRRGPQGAYRLGPAAVGIGEAARGSLNVIELAQDELLSLRTRFQVTTMAGMAGGDWIVVLAACPVTHPLGYTVTAGSTVTFRAPVGPLYVAWQGTDAIEAWCNRADPPLTMSGRDEIERELAIIRSRGWSATVRSRMSSGTSRGPMHEATEDDFEANAVMVVGISAPVWGPDAALECSLAVTTFPDDLTGSDLLSAATFVKDSAAKITAALGGREPIVDWPHTTPDALVKT
jgi:DNA-binding IclR family transcriptional regulator